ncbi:LmbE-like protein [Suhomyces tanzawaensis NRRL Y-17324]|uniref:N-acetylglucosaminylphosphatidylinositol deacetylase n=1 Tax=Suhomyces tanzawaensis NRRL Y-17324 TaxID=984487 RepID=A0A1E4SDC0_9ASCO|nr:LmbE-like protein [Suhomyces tanzawaensis NRRL Y-17324]ODV77468.1 LmbE-like protein [Suhomyces tanzawaensis NRRL Y-17324]
MILRLPLLVLKVILTSFVVWIVLSTTIPQAFVRFTEPQVQTNHYQKSTYPYNSITSPTPLPIQNSSVYFVIGHPDDEVMFFSPSLIEITKEKNGNEVHLVCFSNGDSLHESMGRIRGKELVNSARILGVDESRVTVLSSYKDGMNETWDSDKIKKSLSSIITKGTKPAVLVTFDENGVSNHPNHISLYYGTLNYFQSTGDKSSKLFILKSLNFWEKYSFTFLTNIELFVDHLSKLVVGNILNLDINISFFSKNSSSKSIRFYSDLNMLSVSYAAMSYGHFSQMVWFRYGWLILSRYLTFNHLIEVTR